LDQNINVHITGTGHAVPDAIRTNDDLAKIVDTSDEWITTMTGIKHRHIAAPHEKNSDFSSLACTRALEDAGCPASEVDYIIQGTVTGDLIFPSNAILVQARIGAVNAVCWDISAACSGFLFGMNTAVGLIRSGMAKKILVIGAEILSRFTNYDDRSTCILFGDGAGAVLLEGKEEEGGILSIVNYTDGNLVHLLNAPKGGSADPVTPEIIAANENKIFMKGNEVFKHAVRKMSDACLTVLEKGGVPQEDIDLCIPHQANIRIINAIANRLELPPEKVFVNIEEYGNTSAATIPIALDQARRNGRIKSGDNVVLTVFGGGLTWGAALIRF
jgi:3-oxoacyl-[acyl-carrier-protein] synthase III